MKRCPRCERHLPTDAFARRSASPDGLQLWCRTCNGEWAREHRPRKRKLPPHVQPGYKWCRRCDTVKPVSAFARNRSLDDGLQTYCRDCGADIYRAKRESAGQLVRPSEVPEGFKFCRGCAGVKPLADFEGRSKQRGRATFRCNECMRQWDRERHLQRTYEMTEADVEELLESQSGLCAICQDLPAIHIDHDHATGTVRGMLCFRCNVAIGHFGDDPQTLFRAARYLLTSAERRWPIELYVRAGLTRFDYGPAS